MTINGINKDLYEIVMNIYDEHHLNEENEFIVHLNSSVISSDEQLSKLELFAEILNDLQKDLNINIEINIHAKDIEQNE